jgi:hypothetical protein
MATNSRRKAANLESDPFGERTAPLFRRTFDVLGGRFHFESDSAELLPFVEAAYAGLPKHRFSPSPPEFFVRLMLTPRLVQKGQALARLSSEPPPIAMLSGRGLFGATTDSSTFVMLSPKERTALISVTDEMLDSPYHLRYELLEFAVFTLASRAQKLVPLHAACVGLNGRGILLMGTSGSGKSTVALSCLLAGFDFLSEDSVFIAPRSLRATGTSNFVHVRAESLGWFRPASVAALIRKSPVIRRRSGIKKYEVDLRRREFRLAKSPLKIVALVFLSSRKAGEKATLTELPRSTADRSMARLQAYGMSLPQWQEFAKQLKHLPAFEVSRGRHPMETVEALRSLLTS